VARILPIDDDPSLLDALTLALIETVTGAGHRLREGG
jgi:hypothetical protein